MFSKGQTLIELIIAMTLGLLILNVVFLTYLSVKNTSNYIHAVANANAVGRLTYYSLQNDLSKHNCELLNPINIPKHLKQRISNNTPAIFFKMNKEKVIYFLTQSKQGGFILNRKMLTQSSHIQDGLLTYIKSWRIQFATSRRTPFCFVNELQVKDWQNVVAIQVILNTQSKYQFSGKPLSKQFKFIVKVYHES